MCQLSEIDTCYYKRDQGRIEQGDILRDVNFIFEWIPEDSGKYKISEYNFSYMVVLSQDCDLAQDYNNRNDVDEEFQDAYVPSILVCPAYPEEDFRNGLHLNGSGFELSMKEKRGKEWDKINSNQIARYHHLPKFSEFQIPSLVLDFKHFYTLQNSFLYDIYEEHYLASLKELFREALCQRFSYYISRIGLPKIKS